MEVKLDQFDLLGCLEEEEVYFKRREAAVQFAPGDANKNSILDEKHCRMLGILMGKYRMKNKDESQRQIVATMKRAELSQVPNVALLRLQRGFHLADL
eukprot:g10581.t1